jgi:hypothetical protein
VKGDLQILTGDVMNSGPFDASLTLAADRTPPQAALLPTWSSGGEPVLPGEPLLVRFSKPVPASALPAGVKLLVNGAAVPARVTAQGELSGLALEARLLPSAPVPFGASLGVRVDEVKDLAGNLASAPASTLRALADPGTPGDNGGFERALQGWGTSGSVKTVAALDKRAPREGKHQAVLATPARLVGVFAIKPGAKLLRFWAGALAEGPGFDKELSAVVWLVSGSERRAIFDAATAPSPNRAVLETRPIAIPLGPYVGQRVLVVAETRASGYFGMNYHTVLLDGFSVE